VIAPPARALRGGYGLRARQGCAVLNHATLPFSPPLWRRGIDPDGCGASEDDGRSGVSFQAQGR
jgi:hypothetical protein